MVERLREVCVAHELPAVFNELLKTLHSRRVLLLVVMSACW